MSTTTSYLRVRNAGLDGSVLDDDTEATLHERIKQVERVLYPSVIERLVQQHRAGVSP